MCIYIYIHKYVYIYIYLHADENGGFDGKIHGIHACFLSQECLDERGQLDFLVFEISI